MKNKRLGSSRIYSLTYYCVLSVFLALYLDLQTSTILGPSLTSSGSFFAKGDIADCRKDSHCDEEQRECCARVMVSDTGGNSIDSHYCLQREIIEELGNRYYYKGILSRAYCDSAYSALFSSMRMIIIPALAIAAIII